MAQVMLKRMIKSGVKYRNLDYICARYKMSEKLKGLFEMSRRERRGTVVLLLLMAAVIAVSAIVGLKKEAPPADVVRIEAFDAETDSTVLIVEKPARRHHEKHRRSGKHRPAKKNKPTSDKPRRLDPVPQF